MIPAKAGSADTASKTESAYRQLRKSIILGEIADGERLLETVLASKMNVSRTPIREALQKLAAQGFVRAIPRAGYVVERLSESDIEDLYRTRIALEQTACKWAAEKLTAEETARLEHNLEETDRAIRRNRTENMIELDMQFHHILCQAAKSRTMYRLSRILNDRTLKFRIACIHFADVAQRARDGHWAVFDALRSKDPDAIDRSVMEHLEQAKTDILQYLAGARSASFVRDDDFQL